MRDLFIMVVLLLSLLFAVCMVGSHPWGGGARSELAEDLDIVVLSTGKGLDRSSIGARRFATAIYVNDELMQHDRTRDGLWVVTLTPDRRVADVKSFALSLSTQDMADLYDHVHACPLNAILVMAVSRSVYLSRR